MKISITKKQQQQTLIYTLSYSDGRNSSDIFYESNAQCFTEDQLDDCILFAIIHFAMAEKYHIHLHGTASKKALLNLREYQKAWKRWKPEKYSEIDITADWIAENKNQTGEAISAYSGGADAMFSLFQNTLGVKHGDISYNLRACLLVHGFDIPLSDRTAFETVRERAFALHSELGVESFWIRTNSREIEQDWEDSFAAQLSACLHLFSNRFDTALIGSSEPYDELVIPWGSSPITDHLLSGSSMDAIHYGAGYSRTEKIDYISQFSLAIENLRVCWKGSDKTKNCGVCEKCMRTRLNFEAAGIKNPNCFSQQFDSLIAKKIKVKNRTQLQELRSILNFAKSKGNTSKWVQYLEENTNNWNPKRRHPFTNIFKRWF